MTFIRFKIIDFDIFQKVIHDYKRSKMKKERKQCDFKKNNRYYYNEQSQIRQ